jgi:peptidoglycan/xylan/chitin deacetylase (PgdA/CDA1 family)
MFPILMYHGFTDKDRHDGIENYHGKHLYIKRFEEQVIYLKKNYNIISLAQLLAFYLEGKPLPARCVVITIDDGYSSNYSLAFPVLKKYEAPACIFITTDFVDQKCFLWVDRLEYAISKTQKTSLEINLNGQDLHFDLEGTRARMNADQRIKSILKSLPASKQGHMVERIEEHAQRSLSLAVMDGTHAPLSWEDIRAMQASGLVTIGSHSCSHAILTNCSQEKVNNELVRSKQRIDEMADSRCRYFSYPNGQKGDFNASTKAALINAGYSCALTTVIGTNDLRSDHYELKRLNIHNSGDLEGFKRTLSGFGRFLRVIKNGNLFRTQFGQY